MTRLRRRWLIAGMLFAAIAVGVGSFALAAGLRYATAPTRIEIAATPIDSFDNRDSSPTRFGDLEFRGGLALTAKHPAFGGISGIHVEPDGSRFIAVTDHGSWLRGRMVYRDGKPAGVTDAEMAPILGPDGKPLAARGGRYDTESLAEFDGMLYVGIERVDQIMRFDYRHDGLRARGQAIKVPPEFKSLTYNRSLECLAAVPQGSPRAGELITVTERSLDSAGNLRAFLLGDDQIASFSVKLLVERRYSPVRGIAMRVRRMPIAGIKADALVDGRSMIEADLAYQIDNMEGIAVHRNAPGETIITMVSDDNFSFIQRNLLLQFAVVGE